MGAMKQRIERRKRLLLLFFYRTVGCKAFSVLEKGEVVAVIWTSSVELRSSPEQKDG